MEPTVYDDFQLNLDHDALTEKMRLKPGSKRAADFELMLQDAEKIARPKAAIMACSPVLVETNQIRLGNTLFVSELLWEKIRNIRVVYPYLVTCGVELDQWARSFDDAGNFTARFMADEIMLKIMLNAQKQLVARVTAIAGQGKLARVNPGFQSTWPITEQKTFFELMGDLPDRLEVQLTPSFLMNPAKSTTGIMYPSDEDFDEDKEERMLAELYKA